MTARFEQQIEAFLVPLGRGRSAGRQAGEQYQRPDPSEMEFRTISVDKNRSDHVSLPDSFLAAGH